MLRERDVSPWPDSPTNPTLGRDQVHVWLSCLTVPMTTAKGLRQTLAADELERAHRYRFERDRRRFIVARGVLRAILGRYTGVEPGDVRFRYGEQGKPHLAGETSEDPLHFNVSHSHELFLCAVTRGRRIGVDLEYVHQDPAEPEVAERFFSPKEAAALRRLPAFTRSLAFFNCWTRKEAYIKAKGCGLSMPLDEFSVTLGPGEAAALVETRWDAQEATRWALRDLDAGPGFVAALAVEGHAWELTCWRWNGW